MSFLNTTAKVLHTTPLPSNIPKSQAITMLHDHKFFLHTAPSMSKFEPCADSTPSSTIPSNITPVEGTTKDCYKVTDIVHAIPGGVWDSNVVSTYEFTDLEDGVFVRIRSPLSVVLDTIWTIKSKEGADGELELVEDVFMSCSRLLMGTVKGACESGWRGIHEKMVNRLKGEIEGGKAA